MGTYSEFRHAGSVIRYDAGYLAQFEPRLFEVGWLRSEGHLIGTSSGRGQAYFLSFESRDMVMRPFRRGGLIGRFNRDLYLRGSLESSRAMQEFGLLQWMRDAGLPVPRAVAAQVTPRGLFYRAALLTERIPGAQPMEDALREVPLEPEVWRRVGAVVRQLHDAGVYHSDLNCRNILIDEAQQVWLIDFDKCERRASGAWAKANLERLERSLKKWPCLHWETRDWDALVASYSGA